MAGSPDVVVVGSGIAGGALAVALARAGCDVVVLERQTEYPDRVRGETMFPWGVAEAQALGVDDVLVAAGGGYAARMVAYDELMSPVEAEATALPVAALLEGVPGQLNVGHPQASAALAASAADAGAQVLHGVTHVEVTPGGPPTVRYEHGGTVTDVAPRLVIGADGRQSTVRRACGIDLHETEAEVVLGGILLAGAGGWPADANCLTTERDTFVLGFPRPGGLVRLYVAWDSAQKGRFTGPSRVDELRAVLSGVASMPPAVAIAGADAAGPLSSYPMTDSWTDEPAAPGVVLIGDAAGWSNPVIGQGLSVAMRDARSLAALLVSGEPWNTQLLAPYVEERAERMRRLRICLQVMLLVRCDFTDRGRARRAAFNGTVMSDPRLLAGMGAMFTGPHSVPGDVLGVELVEHVRSLGA